MHRSIQLCFLLSTTENCLLSEDISIFSVNKKIHHVPQLKASLEFEGKQDLQQFSFIQKKAEQNRDKAVRIGTQQGTNLIQKNAERTIKSFPEYSIQTSKPAVWLLDNRSINFQVCLLRSCQGHIEQVLQFFGYIYYFLPKMELHCPLGCTVN